MHSLPDPMCRLSAGLEENECARLAAIAAVRRRVDSRRALFYAGDRLTSLYLIRRGSFKKVDRHENGHEQILSFCMTGDLLGFSAIDEGVHLCDAVALEDSEVSCLPFGALESLAKTYPALALNLARLISSELKQFHRNMRRRSGDSSTARVAGFLLDLANNYEARGYSSTRMLLRMTREEIGAYLGVRLETVSRAISELTRQGVIHVDRRHIEILSLDELSRHASPIDADKYHGAGHGKNSTSSTPSSLWSLSSAAP